MQGIRYARRLLAGLLCILAAISHAAPPARWTMHQLSDLAGGIGSSTALAINNRGDVVGYATAAAPGGYQLHGFLWQNGTMIDLGSPPGSTMSTAEGLNDRGTVLGGDGLGGSWLWKDGEWARITIGGFVAAINRFEAMTGSHSPAPGRTHAFLYRDGVLFDVGTLGGAFSAGHAINDRGAVAGHSTIAGESALHAFVYEDGAIRDLGSFGGYFTVANDINNRGVVVGASVDASGNALAFIHDGTVMRRLLDLPAPHTATAINDRGAIVGDLGQNGSYLYEDGVVTRLESISEVQAGGWTRLIPTGINDRGWITGWGIRSPLGTTSSFVLIPR